VLLGVVQQVCQGIAHLARRAQGASVVSIREDGAAMTPQAVELSRSAAGSLVVL
jgi:hypothetical protein